MIRVVQFEREAQHSADRPERDVTLVPGHAHAENLFAFPQPKADDAHVGYRRRIRTRHRIGQRKGRHVDALGQARQVIVFLLVGAVMNQQLGRPQRIGHHHRDGQRARARTELHHDLRMQISGELQPAILLRNNHAKETLVLDELPHLRRQVLIHVRGFPIGHHRAQLLDFIVEKRNLCRRQARLRIGMQHVPVGLAGKQLALPPHRAGVNRFLLGLRHRRQDLAVDRQQRVGDQRAAQRGHVEHGSNGDKHRAGRKQRRERKHRREPCQCHQQRAACGCPCKARCVHVSERE